MSNFHKVAGGIDVSELLGQLLDHPEVWDKNPARLSKAGPHWDSHDIFIRYKDETKCIDDQKLWLEHGDEHIPVWYKTVDILPACKPLIYQLMASLQSEMLGGVFIYKVEPGHKIYPHIDKGWHPEYYDKFNFCLQSNDKAAFVYDDSILVQKYGDIHFFRNDVMHSVINEGDCDHIIMTVCLRFDRGYRCQWSPDNWSLGKQITGE